MTRPGRRKGIAFSPQATSKSKCPNFADSQKRSQKSLEVVSTQTGQSSLTASCANSEVASPTSENSATFITRQDFSIDSSGNSQEHAAAPRSRKGSSPSLPQCGNNSRVAPCCSASGDSRFSLRNTDGQESQFQKKRRAKNTSAQVTMESQEEVPKRNECSLFAISLRSGAMSQRPFGLT